MNLFITNIYKDPQFFFTVIAAVGFSVCVHEFCHAWMAKKCGDNTAADAGHLTLNPLRQMGFLSIIMLLVLGFCWGAVPVNPAALSKRRRIAVSFAGPGANLGLFCCGIIAFLIAGKLELEWALTALLLFAQLNLVLFCINLAPVPGFDGGNILAELLPMHKIYSSEVGKGFMIGMVLLLFYSVEYIYKWSYTITCAILEFCWSLIA